MPPHRFERGLNVIVRTAGVHGGLDDFAHGHLRRSLVPRRQRDVHVAISDNAEQFSVFDDWQNAIVALQHQRSGSG